MKCIQVLGIFVLVVVLGEVLPLFGQDADTTLVDQTADKESEDKRLPVPSEANVEETTKLVRDLYKSNFQKAKTSALKKALVKKLLADGIDTEDDPTGRYVLFQMARDLAAESGDLETAIEVIDQMGKGYKIDSLEEQAKVVTQASKKTLSVELGTALVELGLEIIDKAIAQDKYELATRVATAILPAVRKTKDYKLLKLLSDRKKEITELSKKYDFVKLALARLEREPTNSKANQAVGEYRCYINGDWGKGLPMLALGSDPALKPLAIADLKGASKASGQVKIGNDWWKLSEKSTGRVRKQLQWRAAHWYEMALPELTGLSKSITEKRLAKIPERPASSSQGKLKTYFLDDLPEISSQVYKNRLGKHGNMSAESGKGKFNGKVVPHALSAHPPKSGASSVVAYDLGGRFISLNTVAALWDSGRPRGPLSFKVIGDDKLLWRSQPVQKAGQWQQCKVSLKGVKILKLQVDCPGSYDFARAVWLNPQVVGREERLIKGITGKNGVPRKTARVGGNGGRPFEHTDPEGLLLLGIYYRKHSSLLPFTSVFRRTSTLQQRYTPLIAKTGYAVGGMNTLLRGNDVRGLQLIFMQIARGRLDPKYQYTSGWIGAAPAEGLRVQKIAGNGEMVLGIYGRFGARVDAIGLIVVGEGS